MRWLYFIQPQSAVFIEGGIHDGLLPRSDTLSAALVSLWPQIDNAADITALAQYPPFRLSSAMPWVTDSGGRRHLLLPVPVHAGSFSESADGNKILKKIAYADTPCIRRLLSGSLDVRECALWDKDFLITSFTGRGNSEKFADRMIRTRLSVDRLSDGPREGLLFDSYEWTFAENCGWAFIAEYESTISAEFQAVLKLLGLEGIGSDRTSGLGQFEILEGPIPWSEPDLGKGAKMLLSLCRPSQDEVSGGILNGSYKILERSGWITVPGARSLRRGRIRMLTEGSWYPDGSNDSPGTVIQVQDAEPDLGLRHPVFRDGRALTISIRYGQTDERNT